MANITMLRILGPKDSPWDLRNRFPLGIFLILLSVTLSFLYEGFLSAGNAQGLLLAMTATGIAAIGTTLLIITGNIDLSIGGQYAIISIVAATVAHETQSAFLAVSAAVGLGISLGLVNGLLVRALRINPLIVTLAAASILRGLAYVFSEGRSVTGFPSALLALGRQHLLGVPVPVVIALVIFALAAFVLARTVLGLRLYAIGGNKDAAMLNGIHANGYITALFAFNGALIGIVSVLSIARLGSASPAIGTGFELDVLTSVLLGGVAFSGGAGNLIGVALGVATIVIINAGIIFAGVPDFWQQVTSGVVLIASLIGDQFSATRRDRGPRTPISRSDITDTLSPSQLKPVIPERAIPNEASGYVLECEALSKTYGSVQAARDIGFKVRPGEIVCLVGDNGAGKSTTIKMLSGAITADTGVLKIKGRTIDLPSPAAVREAGVSTVYQDLALCLNLGAAHNLTLGCEPRLFDFGLLSLRDDRAAARIAQERLADLGVDLPDMFRPVRLMSGGQRQSVSIARATGDGCCVILDEPTAALGVKQTQNVLSLIRTLAAKNVGVVLISHDLESIFDVADRIVVLRLGTVVWDGRREVISRPELVHLMAGFAPASR